MKKISAQYLEISFWVVAIASLAVFPVSGQISLCPLHALGFSWCPGCGLGRSIHLAFSGSFAASFQIHPMGIPAILIITKRIISLFKKTLKPIPNEPCHP